jgi:O-antigen ligase/tetratricopeptide (TPR) repeat protein
VSVGAAAALVYFVTIGGTPAGEFLGSLRIVNTLVAAPLVIYYFRNARRHADVVDGAILAALLLMALSALASPLPRQAIDALLGALAYAAVFYTARDLMRSTRSPVLLWAMRALSLLVTLVAASRLLPAAIEWWQLTGDAPPVGLPLVARPWGNGYDLVLLGVMLFPAWLIPPIGRLRVLASAVVGALLGLVLLMQGARALWLAVALASLGIALPYAIGGMRHLSRRTAASIGGAIAVAAVLVFALAGGIVDRLLTSATVGQRLAMWTAALEAWLQRPVFGFGPGSFPWILQSTDYFETNSIHPRHPDSAIFQLLPELGLLGLVTALILLVGIGLPLIRRRQYLAMWPLAALVAAGFGANPTDFSYLVVVGIFWAAYGLPRSADVERDVSPTWTRPVTAVGLGIIAAFLIATLVAGLAYDGAARRAADGDVAGADAALDTAVALDPGMAIYVRQRGIAGLLLGEGQDAEADLVRAVRLNPNDDLSWRALAIARWAEGDADGASEALQRAIALQRSDPTNLLLRAAWQEDAGDIDGYTDTLAEILLAWPDVIAAPGWGQFSSGVSGTDLVNLALDRWQEGKSSPEPLRRQPLTLAAIANRADLVPQASQLTGESDRLASAAIAVMQCKPETLAILEGIPPSDRRSNTYWALRIQEASQRGSSDATAMELFRLVTATQPSRDDWAEPMNPLHENNAQGSADLWGYDRGPIAWKEAPVELPLPSAGSSRWLLDPAGARAEAGLIATACE